jgi:hypothetical protein
MNRFHKHPKDMSGQRFGKLVAVREASPRKSTTQWFRYWLCVCDCGTEKEVSRGNLLSGKTNSCGCVHARADGMSGTWEYNKWRKIRKLNVCEEWKTFLGFLDSVGEIPYRKMPFAVNCFVPIGPGNVVWRTVSEGVKRTQGRNLRMIEVDGERLSIAQWAEKLGCSRQVIHQRLEVSGWSERRAVTTPVSSTQNRTT